MNGGRASLQKAAALREEIALEELRKAGALSYEETTVTLEKLAKAHVINFK